MKPTIIIKKYFENFIIPLSEEEFSQLENNILKEGCREPLIVWKSDAGLVLLDGHNRFKICEKNGIRFEISKLSFDNKDEAKLWMLNNQLGRRNLKPDQLSYYRGLKYLELKKDRGGYANVKSKGHNEPSTSSKLSSSFKVSESTIKRDAKFAQGLDIVGKSNPALKLKILKGESKLNKADVRILSEGDMSVIGSIKNEADLFNKAKILRENLLNELEDSLEKIKDKEIQGAQEFLNSAEPVFTEKDDRLNQIKGKIISAINRAITKRDVNAIDNLRELIEKLENALFS